MLYNIDIKPNGELLMTDKENKKSKKINAADGYDSFYEKNEENEVIANARAGDNESFGAIAERYRSLIGFVLRNYTIPPSEKDDLLQECYIGLLKAVRTYNEKSASFSTYAVTCMRNSLITALKKYRKETENLVLSDKMPNFVSASPENYIIDRESTLYLYNRFLVKLSDYEKKVFELYLNEKTAAAISEITGRDVKSITNAIGRIKYKLKNTLEKG